MNELIKKYTEFTAMCKKNRIDIYAACVSFYIFLSFIPFAIIILSIIPYLPFTQNDLENLLVGIVPADYKETLRVVINQLYSLNVGTLSISIIATVWAAARGILGITKGLNEIADVNESRNFISMRLWSMFYTIFLIIAIIMTLVITVFGSNIVSVISKYFVLTKWITNLISVKNLIVFLLLAILYICFFTVLPAGKITIKSQIPGAFLAALVWWGFSKIFELYLSTFNSYSIYGSFAVVIIIGIWLYTGMYIMFMGAVLNKLWSQKKGTENER